MIGTVKPILFWQGHKPIIDERIFFEFHT